MFLKPLQPEGLFLLPYGVKIGSRKMFSDKKRTRQNYCILSFIMVSGAGIEASLLEGLAEFGLPCWQ
ncbi:MAG: hypothetical protein AMJ60_11855 [Desulfobacterales bacterium SG8_35]|nr:MAG: hypothetical protein AMJ60_11855 [Desulfobacterales bacterium SG8_35]